MLASIPTATVLGVDGRPVTVEVYVSSGLPTFTVVGLPDASCREARDRVRAALLSSGLPWPMQRITVNLAPSGVPKVGSGFDLAIAIGVLVASDVLKASQIDGHGFIGELGLDGSLRPVPAVLSLVDALQCTTVVLCPSSVAQARLSNRRRVRSAANLAELVHALRGTGPWSEAASPDPGSSSPDVDSSVGIPDMADLHGQPLARLAAEVAATGGHHLLLVGPPGAGKTMLARRLVGLLPPLGLAQAQEVTRVHSAAGMPLPPCGYIGHPPLRAPHHGASMVAMVGGGSGLLRPGEISLAHRGVLFLDELGEFPTSVLDALRQPLEEGVVRVSRAGTSATLPARFLLVAAGNPCPCGVGEQGHEPCRCSAAARQRYARRLSGPLLDRFDLRISVARPAPGDMVQGDPAESTAVVADRVAVARGVAMARQNCLNSELGAGGLRMHCRLDSGTRQLLTSALTTGRLSARGLHRVQRVARTVADLRCASCVGAADVGLALQLRNSLKSSLAGIG